MFVRFDVDQIMTIYNLSLSDEYKYQDKYQDIFKNIRSHLDNPATIKELEIINDVFMDDNTTFNNESIENTFVDFVKKYQQMEDLKRNIRSYNENLFDNIWNSGMNIDQGQICYGMRKLESCAYIMFRKRYINSDLIYKVFDQNTTKNLNIYYYSFHRFSDNSNKSNNLFMIELNRLRYDRGSLLKNNIDSNIDSFNKLTLEETNAIIIQSLINDDIDAYKKIIDLRQYRAHKIIIYILLGDYYSSDTKGIDYFCDTEEFIGTDHHNYYLTLFNYIIKYKLFNTDNLPYVRANLLRELLKSLMIAIIKRKGESYIISIIPIMYYSSNAIIIYNTLLQLTSLDTIRNITNEMIETNHLLQQPFIKWLNNIQEDI